MLAIEICVAIFHITFWVAFVDEGLQIALIVPRAR